MMSLKKITKTFSCIKIQNNTPLNLIFFLLLTSFEPKNLAVKHNLNLLSRFLIRKKK